MQNVFSAKSHAGFLNNFKITFSQPASSLLDFWDLRIQQLIKETSYQISSGVEVIHDFHAVACLSFDLCQKANSRQQTQINSYRLPALDDFWLRHSMSWQLTVKGRQISSMPDWSFQSKLCSFNSWHLWITDFCSKALLLNSKIKYKLVSCNMLTLLLV